MQPCHQLGRHQKKDREIASGDVEEKKSEDV